ncbi:transglutaminase family protein [Poseidonocella sedimentorum]|uniref:Transglutaminase-like enzyme, putative cysteine protease n=1 Tax=Poseidonocella sedimentorum TaxID=871652 RepID=A0A1I6CY10_9RHOB|nr:transglutaminase family protein [Poseidonocella sedimentorum]SFQ98116.1 Transglutaminase-like enzyme, putative cysteine protease [Poseidonocella sedimentorum]
MPSVTITHVTTYHYASPVHLGQHRLMLRPRETRDLSLTSFDLEITPEARVDWSNDVANNAIATAQFDTAATLLSIRSCVRLELRAAVWPVFPIAASATRYPFRYAPDDRTDLGALTTPQYADDTGRLTAWVTGFIMGQPTDTLSLLKDISNGVTARISYQSRETEGTQGPLETLDRGWGSCRDFAVLFAEAVRTLGFGARLVSGYLYDPGGDQLGSADAGSTHAWVEVFVPGAGWIAFDPTNRSVGATNLIPVAVARRIGQVAPVIGSFHGRPGDLLSMDVSVDVRTG